MAHVTEPLAQALALGKSYGPVRVLDGIDFDVRAGEVHALLGGNGAGKSTLMRCLSGDVAPTHGEVRIGGVRLSGGPAAAQARGLYLVPQEAQVFSTLPVIENLTLGLAVRPTRARVAALLAELGAQLDLDAPAAGLEIADRQLVEIARGLLRDARVLILDEPTSALTPHEVSALFARLRQLRAEGRGLVFISHKLPEIRAIADRITVLRDGRVALSAPMAEVTDAAILAAMNPVLSGHAAVRRPSAAVGREVMRVDGLSGEGFRDISLRLRAGEVLGLAGAVGAGRTELAETMVGLRPRRAGTLHLGDAPLRADGPRAAAAAGLVLLSEDRQAHGLFLDAPIGWNIGSSVLHHAGVLISRRAEARRAEAGIADLGIVCTGPGQAVRRLSGGNQQKVLFLKSLAPAPRVLILDEPTRGVDAGAREDIYAIVEKLASEGAAILLISSDFDEIVRLADRIAVMSAGRLTGELAAGATPDAIGALAFAAATGTAHD